ncbi:MAG: glycosyltransferase family 4 protein [Patescibacteria group bacterium]|nr:glycosyltransferase family 4 protein [Patescibacteria group bacterium]
MQKSPHVLMFGWEFPPFNSGGLGTACHGLSHGLADDNVCVTFVLPRKVGATSNKIQITFADEHEVNEDFYRTLYNPYLTTQLYKSLRKTLKSDDIISTDLITEVYRYSVNARTVANSTRFDIIHAHDWLSFGAGMEARHISRKPLVLHVHATELDRTGFNGAHPYIYHIEKEGMKRADRVIAVSGYTRDVICRHYHIPRHKVDVVHNGINLHEFRYRHHDIQQVRAIFGKIVLFVGRLTLQKGADYFLRAAHLVLQYYPDVTFIIAGSGDAERQLMEDAARLGISNKIIFTGFLRGAELNKIYQAADAYVMPSVSEPYGIAALEAIANGTPLIVSKQSGVSEVLNHALKVDFWDTQEMANKILAILNHESLYQTLHHNGLKEVERHTWNHSARKVHQIYNQLLAH